MAVSIGAARDGSGVAESESASIIEAVHTVKPSSEA